MTGSRAWAPGGPRRGPLAAVFAAARAFLLDPPEAGGSNPAMASPRRPVIAVFGLASGCGSTVVSRAIAAELATRDATAACAVACDSNGTGIPLATGAASRLARELEDLPGGARAVGRLCLVRGGDPSSLADALRGVAPLVIDAGSSSLGGVPACVADRTLVVTTPAIEPALARVAIECVARVGPEPILVANRARRVEDAAGGLGTADTPFALPESRVGAGLALGGREVRGALGRSIAMLVDRCEEGA